jgi:cysteine synthase A
VGAVGLVAGWAARTYPAGTTIAAIFPDGPQRYFDTVFNDDYCREHGLLDQQPPPSEPLTVADPTETVITSWTRCARVVDPTRVVR